MSTDEAKAIVRIAAMVLVVVTVAALTLFVFLNGKARTLEQRRVLLSRTFGAIYETIFIYLSFCILWFNPWYLIWLVALTPAVALYTNANRTVLFCAGAIMVYYVGFFWWGWNGTDGLQLNMPELRVFFLPLLYTAYSILKPWHERVWSREAEELSNMSPTSATAAATAVPLVDEVRGEKEEVVARSGTLLTRPARPKA